MRTGSPSHLPTFTYVGVHRYFLTFCTFERARLFTRADQVAEVLSHFRRAAGHEHFAIDAYCFMPDHLHLLVRGETDGSDLRAFIRRAKQFSGFHFKKRFGPSLWQRYGYERVLRDDEATLSVARYVVENPVRAGLVSDPRAFPFAGSEAYTWKEILEAIQMRKWSG